MPKQSSITTWDLHHNFIPNLPFKKVSNVSIEEKALLCKEVPHFFVTFLSKSTLRMHKNSTNADTFGDLSDSCKVRECQSSNQNGDRKAESLPRADFSHNSYSNRSENLYEIMRERPKNIWIRSITRRLIGTSMSAKEPFIQTECLCLIKRVKGLSPTQAKITKISHDQWSYHLKVQKIPHAPRPTKEPFWRDFQAASYAHDRYDWWSLKAHDAANKECHHTNDSEVGCSMKQLCSPKRW